MIQQNSPQPSKIWFIVLVLTGLALLLPFLQYQGPLATGDHGRDLYAFSHAIDGRLSLVPYRDYFWVYGPLMPYYYGLWMKFLGVSILSVLNGKMFLLLLSGVFIALAVATITFPAAGFAAATWFWIAFPDFFHTYNHTGGIAGITALSYFLVSYINTRRRSYLWGILVTAFILNFIKLNIGVSALAATLAAVFLVGLTDKKPFDNGRKKFYILAILVIPLTTAAIYALVIHGLASYEILECFPFKSTYRQWSATPWQIIGISRHYLIASILTDRAHTLLGILTWLSAGRIVWLAVKKRFPRTQMLTLGLSLVALLILLTAVLHEYLSSGTNYCILWAKPVWITLMFIVIGTAAVNSHSFLRFLILVPLICVLFSEGGYHLVSAKAYRSADRLLQSPRGQVYVSNDISWLYTVRTTTEFLKETLGPQETFFALPYDPLYYYSTGRRSPTWQTCFFSLTHIPPEQEKRVIQDLERNHINWVVLSNRFVSSEAGTGVLGRDYCPLLAKYLDQNFIAILQIGDWTHPAGWAEHHGTLILKRKTPKQIK